MNQIWIFGDSFAANTTLESWSAMLGQNVKNLARNGSSEYRIWRAYKHNKDLIQPEDTVIFCHTSFSRVYLKNSEPLLSRLLPSHPFCDLIFSDIIDKQEIQFINILKKIWDEEYFKDTYNLMINDLKNVHNSVHLNFFEDPFYNSIWKNNPGTINHMNAEGNRLVLESVLKRICE
jgi:hypothetical protein